MKKYDVITKCPYCPPERKCTGLAAANVSIDDALKVALNNIGSKIVEVKNHETQ